jgi:CRP-like cAMP-binding protein
VDAEAPVKHENWLLAGLSQDDLRLLTDLQPVSLPLRKLLEQRNRPVQQVFFPSSGIASVIVKGTNVGDIEGGLIGREGVTGLSVLLGADHSQHEVVIQMAGEGHCVSAAVFADALSKSRTLDLACRRYAHAFLVQTSYTALANGRNNIEERLARWLLMSQDRMKSDELELTHDFLAVMLGVRRAGVTLALGILHRAGLIGRRRGKIDILDREGLIELTRGSYGPSEGYLEKLFATRISR